MTLAIIIILVIISMILLVYNFQIHNKIETFRNINKRVNSLNVLQDFMNTLGNNQSIEEKLNGINDIIIEKFNIKYSTIVVFDGADYVVKASNVDEKHWDTLRKLQNDPVFKDSIQTGTPKYITVENQNEKLPYQKMEFGRAKCAKFFPLYIEGVYIGYWIIEGSTPHEFDNQDDSILGVVRKNIVTILKTVQKQETLENIVRDDKFTGLKSAEYLYGDGKKIIDKYRISTVCIFKIVNLPEVNDTIGRKTGDKMVTEVANFVKTNLAAEYVFVRYMGPKFAICFSGVEEDAVANFMNSLIPKINNIKIEYEVKQDETKDNKKKKDKEEKGQNKYFVNPIIRAAVARYYKGTSLDGVLKKTEQYIDSSDDPTLSKL